MSEDIGAALGPERARAAGAGRGSRGWRDEAQGLPRHLSQHPGGMVISTQPLIDCCPIVPAAMDDRQMVQWDKDSCADAGFLKIDLLGLGMLSAVERCVELIARTARRADRPLAHPVRRSRDLRDDPGGRHDRRVPDREPRADGLVATHPPGEPATDLTVQVALVRPGPIVGGAVNPYIERRQALLRDPDHPIPYLHPSLREPLRETLGTIIFQDQVIDVARRSRGSAPARPRGCAAR